MASRHCNWTLTLNNYTTLDIFRWKAIAEGKECQYLIFEEEVGEKGTPHLQGYVSFGKKKTLKGVKELLGNRVHAEAARGSPESNIAYCTKDRNNVVEIGERPVGQGHRSDFDRMKALVNLNVPLEQIVQECTSYQCVRSAEILSKYKKSPAIRNVTVRWYYGATGTGKTYNAIQEAGDDFWISGRNLRWWDGYSGQKNIIVDDFRNDYCSFPELLRYLDKYPIRVEVKGGSVALLAENIWITAPFSPEGAGYQCREDKEQLYRRIHYVKEFTEKWTEVEGNTIASTSSEQTKGSAY